MPVFPVVSTVALKSAAISGCSDRSERHGHPGERILRFGALTLDPDRGCASVDGEDAALSAAEFALLYLLVTRRGVVMSKEAILPALFERHAPNPRIIDVLVLRIRSKLAKVGYSGAITTVWGRGYLFAGPGEDGATPMPPRSWVARPQLALA